MNALSRWVIALLAIAATAIALHGTVADAAAATADKKTVLVLNSERREFPAVMAFETGLREGLEDPTGNVELHFEYLDLGRFPAKQAVDEMSTRFAARYRGIQFDAVLLYAESAADFAIAQRDKLFPGVPVVVAAVDRDWLAGRALPSGFIVVPVVYDFRRTLALAHALQPNLNEVVIVHGIAEFDKRRADEAQRAVESFEPKLNYRSLGGIPLSEIEDEVRRLAPTSMVLLTSMVRDAEGKAYLGQNVAERVALISQAPLYSTFESHFNRGSTGGAITDYKEVGRVAAQVVVDIFNGRAERVARVVEPKPASVLVNWNALQRWHIPEERVPAGAEIRFKPVSFWQQYQGMISGGALAIVLQAVLITLLVLELMRRRRAEQSLRESETRFRGMADAAPVMVWMSGPDKLCTFFNKGWLDYTGRTLEQELGDGWTEGVHPEDREQCFNMYGEAFAARRKFALEYRLRRYDGEYRWITDFGGPRIAPNGVFLGYIGTCVDITERKASEDMLRHAVQGLPTAVMMVNAQGTIVLTNDQTTKLFGYPHQELIGQAVEMLVPQLARGQHVANRQDFLKAPQTREMGVGGELRVQRKDGTEFTAEITLNPVDTHEGLVILASVLDVTERRRVEEELREERAFLRQVIDINPNFIFAKDKAGRFTLVNKAVAEAYGTTVDNLVGKTDADFNPNLEEVEHFKSMDLEVMESLQERFIAEEHITDARGNMRWLQTVKRPILDGNGRAIQVLGASTDITLRKAAEAEVEQNRAELAHVTRVSAMGELAASLAHELNQPLTAIMSNAQAARRFLAMPNIDITELRETISDVVQESTRAGEVIRRMRALVRKGELEVTALDLDGVIRDVVDLVHSDAIMRGVRVALEIQTELPAINGDRIQLQQVMLNLLLNAFDAMKECPRSARVATVRVAQQGNEVRVAVHDRGTGLTNDKLERIFTPFFTTKSEGMGLGLSICRSIIEAHHGRLCAENNIDQGAIFYFTLPVERTVTPAQKEVLA